MPWTKHVARTARAGRVGTRTAIRGGQPRKVVAVAVLAVPMLLACSGCDPFGTIDRDEGDALPAPDSPPLPSCMDDSACGGGEQCVNHRCHTACDESHRCDGAYGLCDTARGIPAPSGQESSTPSSAAGRGICVACIATSDCAPGQVCAVDTGACLTPACEADSDCRDDEVCAGFRCVVVSTVPCTALSARCDGDTAVRCNASGTAESRETCRAGHLCVQSVVGGGGAHCGATQCAPNTQTCAADGRSYFQCDSTGSALTELSCGIDEVCVSGACQPMACVPESRTCSGNAVRVCSADGTDQTLQLCPGDTHCDTGQCVQDACMPSCGDRTCGPDPVCGASCGPCAGSCSAGGQCNATSDDTMEIQLSWTPAALDLDLYVARNPSVDMCNADTCFWGTCTASRVSPDWDGSGGESAGDPLLDVADINTSNPEVVRLRLPAGAAGYRVGVHNYPAGDSGDMRTAHALINVFVNGTLAGGAAGDVTDGELWLGTFVSIAGGGASVVDDGGAFADFNCSSNPPAFISCTTDEECDLDAYCAASADILTAFAGRCAPGCRSDASCPGGTVCSGDRTCVASVQPLGGACSTDADCGMGVGCTLLLGVCEEGCNTFTDCFDPQSARCCPVTHGTCNELIPGFGLGYCSG